MCFEGCGFFLWFEISTLCYVIVFLYFLYIHFSQKLQHTLELFWCQNKQRLSEFVFVSCFSHTKCDWILWEATFPNRHFSFLNIWTLNKLIFINYSLKCHTRICKLCLYVWHVEIMRTSGNYLLWIWYGARGCTCVPYNVSAIWIVITQKLWDLNYCIFFITFLGFSPNELQGNIQIL